MTSDFLIIGAGMAGASIGYELARHGRVRLIERESQPGYHTTGRSAAQYAESYGSPLGRALTRASRAFFETPPEGFTAHPLLTPRGALFVAGPGEGAALGALHTEMEKAGGAPVPLGADEMRKLVPVLAREAVEAGLLDETSRDIDVHALHQGYLAGLRRLGGEIVTGAEVTALERTGGAWRAETSRGAYEGGIVINAAGAWGDALARLAGAAPVGLVPRRRTIVTFDAPPDMETAAWPFTIDVGETVYFKPDAGRILASPADATDDVPGDVQPDEMDVAIVMDRLAALTTMRPRHIAHKWAGLRTFAPDDEPVAGADPGMEGFFWLVGQGGTGIQMAPALARAAAALARGAGVPDDIAAHGVAASALSPARFRG